MLLLPLFLSFLGLAAAHNIQLKAHSRECFHETLHADDKMTVTFQVGTRHAPTDVRRAFDDDAFISRLRQRDSEIKRLLLDQQLISGIGNIYADEALWRTRVRGTRPASKLTRPRARELLTQIREVMGAFGAMLRASMARWI